MDDIQEYDLAKWLADEMSESERTAFENSPGYATYAKIKRYSSQLQAPEFDREQLYANIIEERRKNGAKVISIFGKALRVAAVLVVLLGVGYFAMNLAGTTKSAGNVTTVSFALPDDSQVVLNSGSQIKYKKWRWSNHRALTLDGEAYFKVAKGQTFEVSTALGKVTVLGTRFNVKSRGSRFDVSCYEGRVKVIYREREVAITKGQSVAFANGNPIELPGNNGVQPEWLSNNLAFNKESLENIVAELGRQYDVKIEINAAMSHQLFTGTIPGKDLANALDIIGSTYHLQARKQGDKFILEPRDAHD